MTRLLGYSFSYFLLLLTLMLANFLSILLWAHLKEDFFSCEFWGIAKWSLLFLFWAGCAAGEEEVDSNVFTHWTFRFLISWGFFSHQCLMESALFHAVACVWLMGGASMWSFGIHPRDWQNTLSDVCGWAEREGTVANVCSPTPSSQELFPALLSCCHTLSSCLHHTLLL